MHIPTVVEGTGQTGNQPSSLIPNGSILIPTDKLRINPYRETELPESFKTGFYVLIAISLTALILIIFKIYGLRLTRVERRYGVHGDRSAQELTPLPGAVDEDDSETDDHTVFDINRQQIRVA